MTSDLQLNDIPTLGTLRDFLLAIFILGNMGLAVELLLLGHYEGAWQVAPLLLLAGGLLVVGWYGLARSPSSLRAFQATMLLFLLSGVVGLLLHYRGNVEFELELHPGTAGLALVREALTGATPTLAPGAMLQLGLLGLAWTWGHPRLAPAESQASTTRES